MLAGSGVMPRAVEVSVADDVLSMVATIHAVQTIIVNTVAPPNCSLVLPYVTSPCNAYDATTVQRHATFIRKAIGRFHPAVVPVSRGMRASYKVKFLPFQTSPRVSVKSLCGNVQLNQLVLCS